MFPFDDVKTSLKITNLRLQRHLPGTNEFTQKCILSYFYLHGSPFPAFCHAVFKTKIQSPQYCFHSKEQFHMHQISSATRTSKQQICTHIYRCVMNTCWLIWQAIDVVWRMDMQEKWWLSSCMMTSSNWNVFRVTGHLCREFTGPRWIPRTKASDAELWCFLWSASE